MFKRKKLYIIYLRIIINKCGKIIFVKSQKDIHMLDKCNLRAKSKVCLI